MKQDLKEVNWGRSYPRSIIGVKSGLTLKRKNWGFRLIYDVYMEKDGIDELIGTCHVLEKSCSPKKCSDESRFVAKELVSKSPQLAKRMSSIQRLVQICL